MPRNPNKCKCGKVMRTKKSKRCPACSHHLRLILKSVDGKSMSEQEIEVYVLERTKKFRNNLPNLENGKR